MEKITIFNKRRAFNKAVGPGKNSKINKCRAYVYSGLKNSGPFFTVKYPFQIMFTMK